MKSYYIKLGRGGAREQDCFDRGVIYFGYNQTPAELAFSGDWPGVKSFWEQIRDDAGAATRDATQIRIFYEAGPEDLFITIANSVLYWCHPVGPVRRLPDGTHERSTKDGWHHRSRAGVNLTTDRLSGRLLKTQAFRGTICGVEAHEYLVRKLNDELPPEVLAGEEAELQLCQANSRLLKLLTWQDFETLVELVFNASGFRRVSATGKTQKTIDVELVLPVTGERAFVQIKSQATAASLKDYAGRLDDSRSHEKMFFVWHSGLSEDTQAPENVTLIGPSRLSKMIVEAGLSSWLRDKVA